MDPALANTDSWPAVVLGVYLTFVVLDKLGFWLVKAYSALKPNTEQTALVQAVQKLTEIAVRLEARQDEHERRISKLEDQ